MLTSIQEINCILISKQQQNPESMKPNDSVSILNWISGVLKITYKINFFPFIQDLPIYLLNLTARPKSAIQQVPFFFIKMFLLFRSLCAIAGLPCVPYISVCRWHRPHAAEYASLRRALLSSVVHFRKS